MKKLTTFAAATVMMAATASAAVADNPDEERYEQLALCLVSEAQLIRGQHPTDVEAGLAHFYVGPRQTAIGAQQWRIGFYRDFFLGSVPNADIKSAEDCMEAAELRVN